MSFGRCSVEFQNTYFRITRRKVKNERTACKDKLEQKMRPDELSGLLTYIDDYRGDQGTYYPCRD